MLFENAKSCILIATDFCKASFGKKWPQRDGAKWSDGHFIWKEFFFYLLLTTKYYSKTFALKRRQVGVLTSAKAYSRHLQSAFLLRALVFLHLSNSQDKKWRQSLQIELPLNQNLSATSWLDAIRHFYEMVCLFFRICKSFSERSDAFNFGWSCHHTKNMAFAEMQEKSNRGVTYP